MKTSSSLAILFLFAGGPTLAAERYTEARITQIETSESNVLLYLQVVAGDPPPTGNGGSNESIKPYLMLANSPTDIAERKHLVANAIVALTTGSTVRFRWDDSTPEPGYVVVMLVRS
jgi:hypothetical protein